MILYSVLMLCAFIQNIHRFLCLSSKPLFHAQLAIITLYKAAELYDKISKMISESRAVVAQGVGFRYHARYAAGLYGCTGWAVNEYDGSVTMEIQGGEEDIEKVISDVWHKRFVRIDDMDSVSIPVKPDERGFRTG